MSATSLTLYALSRELVELMDRYDSCREESPDLLPIVEAELQTYAAAHVRKVDSIRQYLKHCELMIDGARREVATQKAHEEAWEARRDRLKALCVDVMQEFQAKRLDGSTGSLMLKGNGGKQPVRIDIPEMVPTEFSMWTGSVSGAAIQALLDIPGGAHWFGRQDVQLSAEPRKSLIEAELQKPCQPCAGAGEIILYNTDMDEGGHVTEKSYTETCVACGGSGKRGVPGCTLEPRGVHLEVK